MKGRTPRQNDERLNDFRALAAKGCHVVASIGGFRV